MKYLKLILAILMLVCLLDMPYGYYQLVRFVSMIAFAWFAFEYYNSKKKELAFACGTSALMFQPFVKLAFGRGIWNIIDAVVAVALCVLWFKELRK